MLERLLARLREIERRLEQYGRDNQKLRERVTQLEEQLRDRLSQ